MIYLEELYSKRFTIQILLDKQWQIDVASKNDTFLDRAY